MTSIDVHAWLEKQPGQVSFRDTARACGLVRQALEYLEAIEEEAASGPVHGARGALLSALSVMDGEETKRRKGFGESLAEACRRLGADPAAVAAWPDFKRQQFIEDNS